MKAKYWIPFILLILVIVWLATGDKESAIEFDTEVKPLPAQKVQVRVAKNQIIDRQIRTQGSLAPTRTVKIHSEIMAKVTEVFVERGDRVNEGQLLLTLDHEDRQVKLAQAESEYQLALLDYKASEQLVSRGAQSHLAYETTKAALDRAKASVEAAKLALAKTRILAPFDGIVTTVPPSIGQWINLGEEILTVMDIEPVIVKVDIPQTSFEQLAVGMASEIELLTGERLVGYIRNISPSASAETRSFSVEVAIKTDAPEKLPLGMSASVWITYANIEAVSISPALLGLDEALQLVVKTVNAADSKVEQIRVDIVRAESNQLWVSGILDGSNIIQRGAGFVSVGQQVEPVPISEENHLTTMNHQ